MSGIVFLECEMILLSEEERRNAALFIAMGFAVLLLVVSICATPYDSDQCALLGCSSVSCTKVVTDSRRDVYAYVYTGICEVLLRNTTYEIPIRCGDELDAECSSCRKKYAPHDETCYFTLSGVELGDNIIMVCITAYILTLVFVVMGISIAMLATKQQTKIDQR